MDKIGKALVWLGLMITAVGARMMGLRVRARLRGREIMRAGR
jgi:hypothetical protein